MNLGKVPGYHYINPAAEPIVIERGGSVNRFRARIFERRERSEGQDRASQEAAEVVDFAIDALVFAVQQGPRLKGLNEGFGRFPWWIARPNPGVSGEIGIVVEVIPLSGDDRADGDVGRVIAGKGVIGDRLR